MAEPQKKFKKQNRGAKPREFFFIPSGSGPFVFNAWVLHRVKAEPEIFFNEKKFSGRSPENFFESVSAEPGSAEPEKKIARENFRGEAPKIFSSPSRPSQAEP